MSEEKTTLKDIGRVLGPFIGIMPKVSPFDTLKRPTGDIPSSLLDGVRRGRLTDKYGEETVSKIEREALSLSYSPDLGKVGTPEFRQKQRALKGIGEIVAKQEKVEKFKISKEQMAFSKKFKQLRKVSLFLQNDLKGQLDGAEMLREQLREVNEELELMSTDAPPPNLNELEGQEEVRE